MSSYGLDDFLSLSKISDFRVKMCSLIFPVLLRVECESREWREASFAAKHLPHQQVYLRHGSWVECLFPLSSHSLECASLLRRLRQSPSLQDKNKSGSVHEEYL